MSANKLLEPEIKTRVLNHLKEKGHVNVGSCVINELTIDKHSRRVDLAVASPNQFMAFEIKSEADSLSRLEGQVEKYLQYFDKVVIVAASKHIEKILSSTPKNVGVWEISPSSIKVRRRGKIRSIKDRKSLLGLMKSNELLKLSNLLGLKSGSSRRHFIEKDLQDAPINIVRKSALQAVIDRYLLSYSSFWNTVGCAKIEVENIDLLSPYKERREAIKVQNSNKERFWDNLIEEVATDSYLENLAQENGDGIFGNIPKEIESLIAA